ncbi:MAG: hypothetical protein KGM83_10865 [Betaproteobacteria bacterium]|nr:hypothetical protein [Betaproteobacteria bacterium]
MAHRKTARLARWQIWLLVLSGGALWLSGAVWLVLHHFGQVQGEFGPEENPIDPWMMRIHGLALLFVLLGIGAMLVAHIPKGWTHRSQRVAGISLCTFLSALIVSGYMLYYVSGDDLREWTSVVHWVVGLPLPAVFVWHYLNGLCDRRRTAKPKSPLNRRLRNDVRRLLGIEDKAQGAQRHQG